MKTTVKFIIGLTVAAAAGAAIGMLLAPEKGSDLQKKLKAEAEDLLRQFGSIVESGKQVMSQAADTTRDEMERARAELKKNV
ncbi:MAG TPA: YtxH domain-containing protein [Cyclobacteriaceae bacterium]|nr:YtxH domain-containing protein [Cyclobacteriaceae bacterium]